MAGMSCTQPSMEECCDRFTEFNYSKWFCMAICVLCCMECTITYDESNAPGIGPINRDEPPAIPATDRNFPIITPNGGFSFTTSEYGRFIPIVFGTDKLTGNVFWSNGFDTQYFTNNGETYYYTTTSFALGICEGEIDALLRLWVGEKLVIDNTLKVDENGFPIPTEEGFILGATVDLTDKDSPLRNLASGKRNTRISVFTGSETQIPEGVMAEEEGVLNTPAYRGLAYILFENFMVTDSSIPAITVEVAANSNPLFPRLYGSFPTPKEKFDQPRTNIVSYDPGYDLFMMLATDTDGTGQVPNGRGFVTFDGSTLNRVSEYEVTETQGVDQLHTYAAFTLRSGKKLLLPNASNEAVIFNPFTGMVEKKWGPHPVTGEFSPDGVAYFMRNHCNFVLNPPGKAPQDIFFFTALIDPVVYNSWYGWGLVAIDDDNNFNLLYKNDTLFTKSDNVPVVMQLGSAFAETQPTFFDGTPTQGTHIWVFSYTSSEKVSFDVSRITVSRNGTLTNPNHAKVGTISADEFAGSGYFHSIQQAFVDPSDNCIILCVTTSALRDDRIAKWNPYTNKILWSTPVNLWDNSNVINNNQQLIVGHKYAFMGPTGSISSIDLSNGELTKIVNNLGDQQLPPNYSNLSQVPFYNGFENSLTYISNTAGQHLVKVFLERTDRTSVPVADIVTYLLKRVGVPEVAIDVTDLSALSLKGYTINNRTTLRAIFAELSQVFRFDVIESNGKIVYKTRGENSVVTVPHTHLGDFDQNGHLNENHENEFGRTRKINLTYRDIDREYGQNVQSVFFPKYNNSTFDDDMAIDVTVPVVLDAATAKKLAEILLYSKIVYEQTYEGVLRPQYGYLDPGDVITLDLEDGPIQIRLRQTDRGADRSIQFRATREDKDIYTDQVNLFGNVGRYADSEITPIQPRVDPFILDIPYRSDDEAASTQSKYLLFMTLLNQRVSTVPTRDLVLNISDKRTLAVPPPVTFPTWGYTQTALPWRSSFYSTDYDSVLRVRIVSTSGALIQSVTKDELVNIGVTCNLAYCGGELIQYETAIDEGNGVWAFTGLQRCRLGTDMQSAFHSIGERFILLGNADGTLDHNSISVVEIDKELGPRAVVTTTVNTNNPFQPSPIVFFNGLNLRPWTVSSFKAEYVGDDLKLSWKRRVRYDGQYNDDGSESLPLIETPLEYKFYLYRDPFTFKHTDPTTYLYGGTITSSEFTYTNTMAITDGVDIYNDTLYCLVSQSGTSAGFDEGAAQQFDIPRKEAA